MDGFYRLTDGRLFKPTTLSADAVTLVARPSAAHPKPETLVLTRQRIEREFTKDRVVGLARQIAHENLKMK